MLTDIRALHSSRLGAQKFRKFQGCFEQRQELEFKSGFALLDNDYKLVNIRFLLGQALDGTLLPTYELSFVAKSATQVKAFKTTSSVPLIVKASSLQCSLWCFAPTFENEKPNCSPGSKGVPCPGQIPCESSETKVRPGQQQVGRQGFTAHSSVSHVAPLASPALSLPLRHWALLPLTRPFQEELQGRSLLTGGHQTNYVPGMEGRREWPFSLRLPQGSPQWPIDMETGPYPHTARWEILGENLHLPHTSPHYFVE